MESAGIRRKKTVCVTGAGGFVASWLVNKLLLSRSRYTVHGTVRDPGEAKNAHLRALDGACGEERLRLFKGDLLDYGSMAAAIAGCDDGVFHVACPVLAAPTPFPEADLLAPALTGTLNVLKACAEAQVKRVVVVSSLCSVMEIPGWPDGKSMDESCWSDIKYCRTTENWYSLSKTLAELEAFDFARRSGMEVVTVCPSLVIGPLLRPTVNASSSVMLDFLKGGREVTSKIRSFVAVRDLADALLLVFETPEVSGRYICNSHAMKVLDVIDLLKSMYPGYRFADRFVRVKDDPPFDSRKLEMLGWKTKPLEETFRDCVESYRAMGVLN